MKPMNLNRRAIASSVAALCLTCVLSACGSDNEEVPVVAAPPDAEDTALKFDANAFTTVNVTIDGVATRVRQYRIVYVAKPVKMSLTQVAGNGNSVTLTDPYVYQTMIVSVPEATLADQKAAIYFAVNNSGWFASAVSTTVTEGRAFVSTTDSDHIGAALKAGFVVVNAGTRSRGARAEDGRWAGKSPAPVVDSKAAIRYLRLNDAAMPGSAARIVMNGTSGGGGLTSAVAASGNSSDYLPFLDEIGAAGVAGTGASAVSTLKDDVFAAVAYCPINNLGNADAGYEYDYSTVRSNSNTGALNGVAYASGLQPAASLAIAATFAPYVASLNLKLDNGSALTAATLREATQALLKEEIERQIARGTAVPQLGGNFVTTRATLVNDWLTLGGSGTAASVTNLDYARFINYVATNQALKTVVAFDAVGVTNNRNATTGVWNISGETNLFGSPAFAYSNFTAWTWTNNQVLGDGSGPDDTGQSWTAYVANSSNNLTLQLKLINPLAYLNTVADSAPYWYLRHGMVDRDTGFSMQTLLYLAVKNDSQVKDVSFKLPYLVPHSGNYDVQEAFTWIKAKLAANPL